MQTDSTAGDGTIGWSELDRLTRGVADASDRMDALEAGSVALEVSVGALGELVDRLTARLDRLVAELDSQHRLPA